MRRKHLQELLVDQCPMIYRHYNGADAAAADSNGNGVRQPAQLFNVLFDDNKGSFVSEIIAKPRHRTADELFTVQRHGHLLANLV
jgi:hypothetical protein